MPVSRNSASEDATLAGCVRRRQAPVRRGSSARVAAQGLLGDSDPGWHSSALTWWLSRKALRYDCSVTELQSGTNQYGQARFARIQLGDILLPNARSRPSGLHRWFAAQPDDVFAEAHRHRRAQGALSTLTCTMSSRLGNWSSSDGAARRSTRGPRLTGGRQQFVVRRVWRVVLRVFASEDRPLPIRVRCPHGLVHYVVQKGEEPVRRAISLDRVSNRKRPSSALYFVIFPLLFHLSMFPSE